MKLSSGYHNCSCRDCMEIYVGKPGGFCFDCEGAGCDKTSECKSDDAYKDALNLWSYKNEPKG